MQLKNKILSFILSLALFGPIGPAPAPQPAYAAGVVGTGFAEETLTVSSSALSITATLCLVRGRQTPALIEVLTESIYFTLDSPTATPDSSDYAAPLGTVISVNKANQIRMIRQSADALVKVTCFRGGQLPTVTSFDKSGAGVSGTGINISQFGGETASTITAHGDNQSNTRNGLTVASYGYMFDGSTWDRARGDSTDGALVNLGSNNDVVATAGLLHGNSPTTEVAIISLFDGSSETQIATTNLGTEKAVSITGTGKLVKMCLVMSLGSIVAEDGTVFFFDADPNITIDAADMSLAVAQTIVAAVSFSAGDYLTNFASVAINCQVIDEAFHSITFAVYHHEGTTLLDDEDVEMHLWYRRDS